MLFSSPAGDHGKSSLLCSSSTASTGVPAENMKTSSQSNLSQPSNSFCQEEKELNSCHVIAKHPEAEILPDIHCMGLLQQQRCFGLVSSLPAATQSRSAVARLIRKVKVHHQK